MNSDFGGAILVDGKPVTALSNVPLDVLAKNVDEYVRITSRG